MKAKPMKKSSSQLRHAPLGSDIERPAGKLRAPKRQGTTNGDDQEEDVEDPTEGDNAKIFGDQDRFDHAERGVTHKSGSEEQHSDVSLVLVKIIMQYVYIFLYVP
jgi:hypothetical protein